MKRNKFNRLFDYIPLKEHFDSLINANKEAIDVRFEAMDKALKLAREDNQLRMNQLNELRQEVVKDRAMFVTREVFDRVVEQFERSRGHQWRSTLAVVLSIVAGLTALIGLIVVRVS